MVQSGLTTPEEGITFSFNPPSSQQLWTPPQQEYMKKSLQCYMKQSELSADDRDPDCLPPPELPSEFDVTPPTPHYINAGSKKPRPHHTKGEVTPPIRTTYRPGQGICNEAVARPLAFRDVTPPSPSPVRHHKGKGPAHRAVTPEMPSEFDVSPPTHIQPTMPAVLKADERENLRKRFQAHAGSPTSSDDTYLRLMRGFSTSEETSSVPVSHSIDPRTLERPSRPNPDETYPRLRKGSSISEETSSVRASRSVNPMTLERPNRPNPDDTHPRLRKGFSTCEETSSIPTSRSVDPMTMERPDRPDHDSTSEMERLRNENQALKDQLSRSEDERSRAEEFSQYLINKSWDDEQTRAHQQIESLQQANKDLQRRHEKEVARTIKQATAERNSQQQRHEEDMANIMAQITAKRNGLQQRRQEDMVIFQQLTAERDDLQTRHDEDLAIITQVTAERDALAMHIEDMKAGRARFDAYVDQMEDDLAYTLSEIDRLTGDN